MLLLNLVMDFFGREALLAEVTKDLRPVIGILDWMDI